MTRRAIVLAGLLTWNRGPVTGAEIDLRSDGHFTLGNAFVRSGDHPAKAVPFPEKVMKADRYDIATVIELAESLALAPETKACADALCRDAIRRFPNHEGLLTSLAQTCMQWGEFRRARRVIVERLLVIAPQTVAHRRALEFVDRKTAAMKK